MRLYPIPGGDWAPTEADWKKAMKARGLDPKQFEATKTREVPTGKKELMEFLIFFGVDVYRTGVGAPAEAVVAGPDPDAPPAPKPAGIKSPIELGYQPLNLPELFEAAPIRVQAELVVAFADRAVKLAG